MIGDAANQMGADLPAINLGSGVTVSDILAGDTHVCALVLPSKQLKCWGYNNYGQLGYGDTVTRGLKSTDMGSNLPLVSLGGTVTSFTVGGSFTCALLSTNAVKCWGYNSEGQLFTGDRLSRGGKANQMGTKLLPINLGTTGLPVQQVSAGENFACALFSNNAVKCWGENIYGQLGLGNKLPVGFHKKDLGNALPFVDFGTGLGAAAMSVGFEHVCVVVTPASASGNLKCWGGNGAGKLGIGSVSNQGNAPNQMGDDLQYTNLGTGLKSSDTIAAGGGSTCSLIASVNRLKCWGWNYYGQLGLGDANDRGNVPNEMGNALPYVNFGSIESQSPVIAVSLGEAHSCAIFKGNELKCWGLGDDGELGYGNANTIGISANQMGNALPNVNV